MGGLLGIAGPVGELLCTLVLLYTIIIFLVIVFSWFPIQPGGGADGIFRFLRRLTDPVLLPLRRLIPPIGGAIDVSPILVILVLFVLRGFICP
jgi:YggT family protein